MATSYSPSRRTALVLSGTGAHGAYHAGVLRALHEGGVKIDVVAGHGIGSATAALAAIGGSVKLWEQSGIWSRASTRSFYGLIRSSSLTRLLSLLLCGLLIVPLALVAIAIFVYAVGFLVEISGVITARDFFVNFASWLQSSLNDYYLSPVLPRIVTGIVFAIALLVLVDKLGENFRLKKNRRKGSSGRWPFIRAPFDGKSIRTAFRETLWKLVRGSSSSSCPNDETLGKRYIEVLLESLGQPGFCELLVVATDIDARRDLVAALLKEPFRHNFLASQIGIERAAEAIDLSSEGRDHAIGIVLGGLTPSQGVDPYYMTFAADSYWRGETHRLCDRAGSIVRLFEELQLAGVEQVVVVTAVPSPLPPHRLTSPKGEFRNRLSDFLMAAEAASLRDALVEASGSFEAVFLVAPDHNPVSPFDFNGSYDDASDRQQTLAELMECGYEDARHQFIESIVGASGEHLNIRDPYAQRVFDETDT